jgi:hypothetical protein
MVWQYSHIAGTRIFLESLIHKFIYRTGVSSAYLQPHAWKQFFIFYAASYLPLLLLLFWAAWKNRVSLKALLNKHGLILYLAFFSVLLHHILLFNFTTIHDFSTLKFSVFLSISLAIFAEIWMPFQRRHLIGFAAVFILCCLQFWAINHENRDMFLSLGKDINRLPQGHLVVIKGNFPVDPQLIYYAKRNIVVWESDQQIETLRIRSQATGVDVLERQYSKSK